MADALSYQLKLIDQMSGPAKQADNAIGVLALQLKKAAALEKELGKETAQAAKILLKEQTTAAKQAAKEQAAADAVMVKLEKQRQKEVLTAQKQSEKEYQQLLKQKVADEKKAEKELEKQKKTATKASDEFQSSIDAATADSLDALSGGATIAAKAVLALGAAFTAAVIGGAALAIKASEAKQDTLDLLDAMLGSQAAAQDVYKRIEDLTGTVAISQERGVELAKQLSAAGITNAAALTQAIKSIGQVESVLGAEAGGKIQNILEKAAQSGKFQLSTKQLVGTGIQVKDLYAEIAKQTHQGVGQVAAEVKKGTLDAKVGIDALNKVLNRKFAGPAEQQVKDFGNQLQHLKDNIGKLFEDINTEPFLDALHDVLGLFDQNTATGKALHDTLTTVFDGVFEAGKVVLPYIKTALKGLVIIGLQVGIAFKPLIKAFKDAFGGDQKSGVDALASAMSAVGEALGTVVGWVVKLSQNDDILTFLKITFIEIGIAVAAVGVAVGALLAPFYALGAAIVAVTTVGAELIGWAINLGGDLITGLIKGLQAAGPALIQGLKDIGNDALAGFKKVFGIASPSKVMAQMGKHMMSGLEMGIDLSAPAANDTLAESVSPAPAVRGGAGGGTTVTHNAGGVTINITINGIGSVDELKEVMPSIMADALEQAGLTVGAPQAA